MACKIIPHGPSKFWVVDQPAHHVFAYDAAGNPVLFAEMLALGREEMGAGIRRLNAVLAFLWPWPQPLKQYNGKPSSRGGL